MNARDGLLYVAVVLEERVRVAAENLAASQPPTAALAAAGAPTTPADVALAELFRKIRALQRHAEEVLDAAKSFTVLATKVSS